MGSVYAEIELINAVDFGMAKRHQLDQDEVKKLRVTMLVDSGAWMMAINESIQEQLDLPLIEKRKVQLADSRIVEYPVVGPIIIKFENRTATANAFVLQGDSEPLLGAIPMEEMDVLINPARRELIVNPEHPHHAVMKMKGIRK